jgi:hypothetical protein
MTRGTIIAGVTSFAATLIASLLLVGAVRTDTNLIGIPQPNMTASVAVAGGGLIDVDAARLDLIGTDPAGVDLRPAPPDGSEQPPPDGVGGGGPADAAAAMVEADLADRDLLIIGVPLDVDAPDGFVDGCIDNPADCPFGLGAVVLDPVLAEGLPLEVVASHFVAGDPDTLDRCQVDYVPDEHNLMVFSTNPVAIEARYGILAEELELTASDPGPQAGDAVYQRWEVLNTSGEIALLPPIDQVVWCVPLTGVAEFSGRAARWNVSELVGRDLFGQTDTLDWWISFDVGTTDWPPFTVGRGQELLLRAGVWERTTGALTDTYRGMAWPIDLTDPGAESCTDVESRIIASTESVAALFWDHPEMDYNFAPVALNDRLRPSAVYGTGWAARQFTMPLREGRAYTICAWELKRGLRTFDTWEVVHRESREISTPNLFNLTVSGSVAVSQRPDLPMVVTAIVDGPTRECRMYSHGASSAPISTPGQYPLVGQNRDLDDPTALCQSMGWGYDDTIIVTPYIRFDGGSELYPPAQAIVLDTRRGCDFSFEGEGCVGGRTDRFQLDVSDPACPECDPIAQIGIQVDFSPSTGGGRGSVRVGEFGDFGAAEPQPPTGGPQLDEDSLEFGPVDGSAHQMSLSFVTDRPVEAAVELVPHPKDVRGLDCELPPARALGELGTEHSFIIDGLCAGTLYSPTVTLVDATGTSSEISGAFVAALTTRRTNGFLSTMEVTVTLMETDRVAVEARCREIADVYQFNDRVPDPFDPFCAGLAKWVPLSRGVAAGSELGNPTFWDYCLDRNLVEYRQATTPRLGVYHTDRVEIDVRYVIDQTTDCGLDGFFSTGLPFTHFERTLIASLTDIGSPSGVSTTFSKDGLTWRIEARASGTEVFSEEGHHWDAPGP